MSRNRIKDALHDICSYLNVDTSLANNAALQSILEHLVNNPDYIAGKTNYRRYRCNACGCGEKNSEMSARESRIVDRHKIK